jgi:hypothetical protein
MEKLENWGLKKFSEKKKKHNIQILTRSLDLTGYASPVLKFTNPANVISKIALEKK